MYKHDKGIRLLTLFYCSLIDPTPVCCKQNNNYNLHINLPQGYKSMYQSRTCL